MMAMCMKLQSVFTLFLGLCFCPLSASVKGRIQRPETIVIQATGHTSPINDSVNFTNITVENTAAFRDNNVYSFNTTFVWGEGNTRDISYEIGFVKVTDNSLKSCRPSNNYTSMINILAVFCEDVVWYNTSTNQILLEAPYSFEYFLFIRPWNRTSGIYWHGLYKVLFPYEDCFETTNDRQFCRNLDVDVISHVVGLSVDIILDQHNMIAANVTWLEPVQVAFEIGRDRLYKFSVQFFSAGGSLVQFFGVDGSSKSNELVEYRRENPSLVYNVKAYLKPFGTEEQYRTYRVKVIPLFDGEWHARHIATLKFNLTQDAISFADKSTTTVISTVTQTTSQMPSRTFHVTISLVIALLGVIALAFVVFLMQRFLPLNRPIFIRTDDEVMLPECLPVFAAKELYSMKRIKYAEGALLGTGQYGSVYKGEVYNVCNSKEWKEAAIKVAKENEIGWKEDFLDEIKLILELGPHPNIIEILGCCTVSEPPLLITEYMKYGDLLHFLHKCRKAETEEDCIYFLTEASLIFIALQVADGMEFMSASKFYHGDLAARNILITDGLVAKIADFGLAGALNEKGYKRMAHGRKRPMRWVSLETLQSDYCSHKSDVWSYGVLLYEIFTFGATPYHDIPIHELPVRLLQGYRLPRPWICPVEIYRTMLQCWLVTPNDRPLFSELKTILECYQQTIQIPHGTIAGTSADSFVSNPDLRSAIFQPFLEEDEIPSVPVLTTVSRDSDHMGDSESIFGSDSVVDSGFAVDSRSGSIDNMCLETLEEKTLDVEGDDAKKSMTDLGEENLGFHDMIEMEVSERNSEGKSHIEEKDLKEDTSMSLDDDDHDHDDNGGIPHHPRTDEDYDGITMG